MAEMYHPELDATVTVRDDAVERYEGKGWQLVEDDVFARVEEVVPAGDEEEEEE
jgi:hypothetical protein